MAEKILICPGHGKSVAGGYDPGATAGGYNEYSLALEVAKAAYAELLKYDCEVDIINQNRDYYLLDRIKYANRREYSLVAEIHLNAGGGSGSEVYYAQNSTEGKRLAENISAAVAKGLKIKNRGAKTRIDENGRDYFGIIRSTNAEAVLVETCFIDSGDLKILLANGNRQIAGRGIADAIAQTLGLKRANSNPPQDTTDPMDIAEGSVVYFGGGNVYISSSAKSPSSVRGKSSVKITKIQADSLHPYHAISVDGGGVYGWIDKANILSAGKPDKRKIIPGNRVYLKKGAKSYSGEALADFVYKRQHIVSEINGDRAVITYNGIVVAAVNRTDLTLA